MTNLQSFITLPSVADKNLPTWASFAAVLTGTFIGFLVYLFGGNSGYGVVVGVFAAGGLFVWANHLGLIYIDKTDAYKFFCLRPGSVERAVAGLHREDEDEQYFTFYSGMVISIPCLNEETHTIHRVKVQITYKRCPMIIEKANAYIEWYRMTRETNGELLPKQKLLAYLGQKYQWFDISILEGVL